MVMRIIIYDLQPYPIHKALLYIFFHSILKWTLGISYFSHFPDWAWGLVGLNENQEVSELTFKPNFCTLWLVSVITSCCLMECLLIVESGSDMSIRSHSLNDKRRRFIFMSGLMKALSFYSHLLWGTLGTFNASQRKS